MPSIRAPHCFSPDGQRLVLAADDHSVRVWDAASGKPLGEPMPHRAAATAAGFSADGKRVYTACLDGLLRWFEADSGQALGEVLKHPQGVAGALLGAVSAAPGGLLLSWCDDFSARLFQADSGKPVGRPMTHAAAIACAAFSASGKLVLTASADRTARLWSSSSGEPQGDPFKHPAAVQAAGFAAADEVFWTLADDGLVRLWSLRSRQAIADPLRHEGVHAASAHPAGRVLATGGRDKAVRLWDAANGRALGEPLAMDAEVLALSMGGAQGELLAAGGADGQVRLWLTSSGKALGEPLQHKQPVRELGFDHSGEQLLTISAEQVARLWQSKTGRLIGQPIRLAAATGAELKQVTTRLGDLSLLQLGTQSVLTVAGITGVFTPLTSARDQPLVADERENLLTLIDRLKREVSEVQGRNLRLEADLALLRERPSPADDFAGAVQQSLDELQQRMATMRNSTSNFAVREFKLDASVYVQLTPLGQVEYRFVQPGMDAPAQTLSRLSLQVVPVPKDNLAGVYTPNLFQPEAPVALLSGLGDEGASRMESAGLFTLGEFLQVGTRARTQATLSALLGVDRQRVALWAQQALLLTLRGMDGASALVLIGAGLGRFEALAGKPAQTLVAEFEQARAGRPDLGAPTLGPALAALWVRAARQYLGLAEVAPEPEPPPVPPPP